MSLILSGNYILLCNVFYHALFQKCGMFKSAFKKDNLESIIYSAKNGNNKAVEELIRFIQKDVYAIFSHLIDKKDDISDLTQEALLKMARGLPSLHETGHFKQWLHRIITNVFYDYNRKSDDKVVDLDEDRMNEIKDKLGCEPGERCLFSEIEKLIRAALMTLPKQLRITLILREYEGMSYEDIANITNTTLGTVKSRISRARLKLQDELKEFI